MGRQAKIGTGNEKSNNNTAADSSAEDDSDDEEEQKQTHEEQKVSKLFKKQNRNCDTQQVVL